MYRSRMPYIRWHARSDQVRERLQLCNSARYAELNKFHSGSFDTVYAAEETNAEHEVEENDSDGGSSNLTGSDSSKKERNRKSIRQQQREIQQKCKRVAFGTQSQRFEKDRTDLPPPPGTYDVQSSYMDIAPKSECRKTEPFSLAPVAPRSLYNKGTHLGPGIYDAHLALSRSTVVTTKGRFDCYHEPRCGPIKTGYMASVVTQQSGPTFTNFPTFIDQLTHPNHNFKGKFLKDKRFQKFTTQHDLGPASYSPKDLAQKRSFNRKKVPFLSQSDRMTKRQYQRFIGNMNPYTGPGSYNPFKHEKMQEAHSFSKEELDQLKKPERIKAIQERLQPTNIPKDWITQALTPNRDGSRAVRQYLKLQ